MRKAKNVKNAKSFLTRAFTMLILSQVIACNCDNNKGGGGDGKVEGEEKKPNKVAKIALTGPNEVKGGLATIDLEIEVTGDKLDMKQYTLEAIDVKNFSNSNYTSSMANANTANWTKVSGSHGKTLEALTGTATLNENSKIVLSIPLVWADVGGRPYARSAKFRFRIRGVKGKRVAGPIDVNWTTDN